MIILRETELRRDILEVAVALVAVEAVDAVARDEQVEFAVIVKVANRAADAAIFGQTSGAVHTERGSDVDEAPAVVAPQRVGCAGLVGKEEIEIAIAVVIEPAGTHGRPRSEEHTSELKSLMRNSYAV